MRRFVYDGDALIGEYDDAGTNLHRYLHGAGVDEPIAWDDRTQAPTITRRYMHADERGSIIAYTTASDTVTGVNRYDEYGTPQGTVSGRFQYTGQMWIASLGMYYYRARMYHPGLGRFMQPDPIRYGGGMNLYAYVGNDPVNLIDPNGLRAMHPVELAYGRSIFHNQINYGRVDIVFGSWHPAALAVNAQGRAVTVGNTIYFPRGYENRENYYDVLVHELTHVWQYQSGAYTTPMLMIHQILNGFDQSIYTYPTGPDVLFDYLLPEAQAQVIQDCSAGVAVACRILRTSRHGFTRPPVSAPAIAFDLASRWSEFGTLRQGSVTVEQEPGTFPE